MNNLILNVTKLCKSYNDGASKVNVLRGIDLSITQGERLAIIGPSGSGKSTLLHLLGGLDQPTSGDVWINGVSWQKINEKKRCQLRNQGLGFIYQFHHLLPEFTALENVAMPLLLAKKSVKDAETEASKMLDDVGLKERKTHKPAQLSGGERQRVAIARALVHQPYCVLADEPTGNLDQVTATKVFELMLELNRKMNTALVIVTHDHHLAKQMDRVLVLGEGLLSDFNQI
ncbi:lipoprotein releasing system ATP-binding protein [Legionella gratiana]|uniref:Lipoprotein-releasing system ATP-binding protein LolD n=1 Tax=Legionella gratiana TaxID=45066 RepID=A0A378JDU4_9GAMM|nr:lipoprotein-releasing ABC transporter ATP-binding protein LolD [Legionella gratiana]KTD05428.1 lipoprotein releasing system ATP-binding protein [Legionella gratiana]STX46054.1 outer membrane-specific lipoprotein transporter subunit; ATP-binding component of ABC superfamily [Legionella gratiana]